MQPYLDQHRPDLTGMYNDSELEKKMKLFALMLILAAGLKAAPIDGACSGTYDELRAFVAASIFDSCSQAAFSIYAPDSMQVAEVVNAADAGDQSTWFFDFQTAGVTLPPEFSPVGVVRVGKMTFSGVLGRSWVVQRPLVEMIGSNIAGFELKGYSVADPSTPYTARFGDTLLDGNFNPDRNGFYHIETYYALVPAPEPATYALCGAALLALAMIRRR